MLRAPPGSANAWPGGYRLNAYELAARQDEGGAGGAGAAAGGDRRRRTRRRGAGAAGGAAPAGAARVTRRGVAFPLVPPDAVGRDYVGALQYPAEEAEVWGMLGLPYRPFCDRNA